MKKRKDDIGPSATSSVTENPSMSSYNIPLAGHKRSKSCVEPKLVSSVLNTPDMVVDAESATSTHVSKQRVLRFQRSYGLLLNVSFILYT